MENIIKKTVNIEDSTSRVRGLVPTIDMGVYVYDSSLDKWKKSSSLPNGIEQIKLPVKGQFYIFYDSFEEEYNDIREGYRDDENFYKCGYRIDFNDDNICKLVLYKEDIVYETDDKYFISPDYKEVFYYVGTTQEIGDGIVYDKWKKIENDNIVREYSPHIYMLTEKIVSDDVVTTMKFVFSNEDFINKNEVYFSCGLSGNKGCMGNWGKIPKDIRISNCEYIYKFNIPYDIINEKEKLLRHSNMMEMYYWLNNFIKTSSVYRLCKRKNNYEWLLDTSINLKDLYCTYQYDNIWHNDNIFTDGKIPNVCKNIYTINKNDYEPGSIIVVNNSFYEEYVKFFNDNCLHNSIILYNFIEKAQGKLYIPEKIEGTLVPSYIDYYSITEWYEFLNSNKFTTEKTIKYKYENMGGDDMLNFLSDKNYYFINTINYFLSVSEYPYSTIPLSINNRLDDMGMFNVYSQEWFVGNRYYVGDTVIYTSENNKGGNSFTLKYGDKYELIDFTRLYNKNYIDNDSYYIDSKQNIEEINDTCKSIINNINTNMPHFINENGKKIVYFANDTNKYYLPLAYYTGYQYNYDILFDEFNESGKPMHWVDNCGNDNIESLNIDGYKNGWKDDIDEKTYISTQSTSKLSSFMRWIKNYDDSGKELKGIIKYDIDTQTNAIKINEMLEIPYLYSVVVNIVEVKDENNEVISRYGDMLNEPIFDEEKNVVTFEYFIGCEVDLIENNGKINYILNEKNSGMKYKETYPYKIESTDYTINGETINFTYKNIDFSNGTIKRDFNSNEYYKKIMNNDSYEYINSLLYYDESCLGISTPFKIDTNVNIDRGNTTAYEKYYMLTEVKNLNDLEQYRNNFFKVKK